jgi:hypothetical protein
MVDCLLGLEFQIPPVDLMDESIWVQVAGSETLLNPIAERWDWDDGLFA